MKKQHYLPIFILVFNNLAAQYAGQVSVSTASQSGLAQAYVNSAVGGMNTQFDILSKRTGINDFQGSPYTSDTFQVTKLYYENEEIGKVFYRYNAYNEEIEVKNTFLPEETIKSVNKDKAISILVDNNRKMSFKTFIDKKGNTLNGYLIDIWTEKKYSLYKRINVKFTEGQKAQNSFVKAVPNRFTHFTEYYFKIKGINRIDEVPFKKNKLVKMVEEQNRAELTSYIKENRLVLNSEADLIRVFEYLNNR